MSQTPDPFQDNPGSTPPPVSYTAPGAMPPPPPGYLPPSPPPAGYLPGAGYAPNPAVSDKLILPAALLCWFLGYFGVHRFYVGKTGSAIAQLILSITIVGLIVSIPWLLIDFIMIVVGSFKDSNGKELKRWT